MGIQYWLAELDRYGNPKLIDGAHEQRSGVEEAAALIRRLGLARDRRFAVAEVHLSDINGEHGPLDEEAIGTLNAIGLRPQEGTPDAAR